MERVVIGVDPHKLSATIEVVDDRERRLGSGRFTTNRAGYAARRTYAKAWPTRVWAVEGANGVGRAPQAQDLRHHLPTAGRRHRSGQRRT
jgi:hypothetical protein